LITLVRLASWQLHRSLASPELWTLALGYLWLIPGLLLKALAQTTGILPITGALHALTLGAVGTITLVMAARIATLRAQRPLRPFADIGAAAVLVSVATLLRLLATITAPGHEALLWLAGASWSLAFVLLLIRLVRLLRLRGENQLFRASLVVQLGSLYGLSLSVGEGRRARRNRKRRLRPTLLLLFSSSIKRKKARGKT